MKPRDPRSRRAPRDAQRRRLLKQRRAAAQGLVDRHRNNALFPLRGRGVRRRAVTFTMREMDRVGRETVDAVSTRVVEHVYGHGDGLRALMDDVSRLLAKVFMHVIAWMFAESWKRRPRPRRIPGGLVAVPMRGGIVYRERESANETWNPPPDAGLRIPSPYVFESTPGMRPI